MKAKITVKLLERLPPVKTGEPETVVHDPSRPGFFVRKQPNATGGAVSFWANYTAPGTRRRRRVKLAEWPRVSLEKALELWRDLNGAVADGQDPAAEQAAGRARPIKTVADLWRDFATRKGIPTTEDKPTTFPGPLKPKTALNYWMDWKNILGPEFGSLPLANLTRAHVSRWHHDNRHRPGAANHALRVLRALANWGVQEGHLETNPVVRIAEHKLPERGRLFTPAERKALLEAIRAEWQEALASATRPRQGIRAAQARKRAPHAAALVHLLLLTGLRLREVQGARWEAVSFEEGTLRLADTKTGPRVVDLSEEALAVLRELHARRRCDWIIENAEGTGPLADCRKAWGHILERAGLAHLRLHDLRHARVSELFEAGLDASTVSDLTGQRSPATLARYRHTNRAARRAALEKAAEFVRSREGRPAAKVEDLAKESAG
jgi:integrase